jgi:hypothetical protein
MGIISCDPQITFATPRIKPLPQWYTSFEEFANIVFPITQLFHTPMAMNLPYKDIRTSLHAPVPTTRSISGQFFDLPSDWTTSDSELLLCIGNIFDGYFNPYNKVKNP